MKPEEFLSMIQLNVKILIINEFYNENEVEEEPPIGLYDIKLSIRNSGIIIIRTDAMQEYNIIF